MPKKDKKQRHKAKREAKRLEARRQSSVSPLKRLADSKGELECWMSHTLEEMGQLTAFVYKRAAGLAGISCFLVDRGVVGLKDTWSRMNVESTEFRNMIETTESRGILMKRVTPDEVRQVVAGAAAWTHQNGMRLPKDWTKCALLFGGIGDWMSADTSAFEMEFAGHPNDLRQRLISERFETFIQRPDIHFIFSSAAPNGNKAGGMLFEDDDLDEDGDDNED